MADTKQEMPQTAPPPYGYNYGQDTANPNNYYPSSSDQQTLYPGAGGGSAPQTSHSHSNNMTVVTQQPQHSTVVVTSIDDHLGLAIFTCLCCFWPLGLAAIIVSNQARDAIAGNNLQEAQRLAATSRKLSLLSVMLGIICIIVVILVRVFTAQ